MSPAPEIAIVGGGFSGTLLAVQLAMKAMEPLHITLYDASGAFARGIAYGTREHAHLLNVPAIRMGAFPDKIEDFHHWLDKQGHDVAPTDFAPRILYAEYLASLLASARKNPRVILEQVKAEVTDATPISEGFTLTLGNGTRRNAALLALAPGGLASQPRFKGNITSARFIENVWSPPEGSILTRTEFTPADEPVLILGTGLSMIDMVLSLRMRGYAGKIVAVSRHGLLPQPHAPFTPCPPFLSTQSAPRTALGLLHAIRSQAKRHDWRAVVDSLRADTPALWAQLPEKEKRRLTRVLSFWGTHRHRMAPSSAEKMQKEMDAGTLEVRAAGILTIVEDKESLKVTLRIKGNQESILAAHVLNCTGATPDIRHLQSPLLASLSKQKLISPGPLGWGIAADGDGRVKGAWRLYALGPLLTGERLETIAVPELRQQAETAAESLLAELKVILGVTT